MPRPRVVIVGAGFAGFETARRLSKQARGALDIAILNPTDYFLYLPLLPEVAGGVLDPRRVAIPLAETLPGVRIVLGRADGVDVGARTVSYRGADGDHGTLPYDRLVLAAGSVNKLLPIPGVAEHAHGFRGIAEALYLRDHVIRQLELADDESHPAERAARCTFVVVGAGYTGTEVAAQGQLLTHDARHGTKACGTPGSAGSCSTPPTTCSPAWTATCRPAPSVSCVAAGSTSGSARRCRRRPWTASTSPTAASSRRGRSCGASACGQTRWRRAPGCR